MGLNVVVGFAEDLIDDEEGQAWFAEQVAAANAALARAGLPTWEEPDDVEPRSFEMYGYSGLHTLRRVAAHLREHGRVPPPLGRDEASPDDATLAKVYAAGPAHGVTSRKRLGRVKVQRHGTPTPTAFDHVVHHSDAEGFYAPVDFAPVLQDSTVVGGFVGAAPRLLAECRDLAAALGIDPEADPDSEEVFNAVEAQVQHPQGWQLYAVETFTCLQLIRASQAALATGAALVFS
ncbi:MAG: hypothetical protein ACRDO4_09185 [Nocardioides sp.]